MRYGAEFFANLYAGKKERNKHKAFTSAPSKQQDSLGALNDIATGHELIDDLIGKRTEASVSFAAGLTLADIEAKFERLVSAAAAAQAERVKVRPFWR